MTMKQIKDHFRRLVSDTNEDYDKPFTLADYITMTIFMAVIILIGGLFDAIFC